MRNGYRDHKQGLRKCLKQADESVPSTEDQHRTHEGGDGDYEQDEPGGFVPLMAQSIEPAVLFPSHTTKSDTATEQSRVSEHGRIER